MNAVCFEQMSDVELLTMLCGTAGRVLAKASLPEIFGFVRPKQEELFGVKEEGMAYQVHPQIAAAKELMLRVMQCQMQIKGVDLSMPGHVRSFLCGRFGNFEHEVFYVLFLDAQLRLITAQEMFRGTVSQTSVYPREVVKSALAHNASAVILAHNHPSGFTEPSRADIGLTRTLKEALTLIDVRVLDHVIVAGNQSLSMAERGLM